MKLISCLFLFLFLYIKEGKNMERVCKLKKEVSQMIYKEELLRDKLELVDTLQRLGVAYHFKDKINCVLTNIHQSMGSAMPADLYEVSLLFRLLRMHGFSVQEGIFFVSLYISKTRLVVNYHVYFTLTISDSTLNELSG